MRDQREAWDDLGFAFLQKGELKKAETYLKKSIPVHPENYNPRFYLALAYLLDNEIELASEQLEKVKREIYFDDSWIREKRSQLFKKSNGKEITGMELERIRKEKGIWLQEKANEIFIHLDAFDERNEGTFSFVLEIVNKIIEGLVNPDDSAAKKKIEQALVPFKEVGRDEEGLKKFNLISQRPQQIRFNLHHRLKNHNNDLLYELHRKFFKELKKGRINDAIDMLEESLFVNEQSLVVNHNLALLYFDAAQLEGFNVDKLERAEIYCARALWFKDYYRVNKDNIVGCHDLMGNIYNYQNEFEKILEIDSLNSLAYCNLGSVYNNLNDMIKAEKEWKKAIECEKDIVRAKRREAPEGELKYILAVVKEPASFRAHLYLGMLYLEQNLNSKALEELKQATALEPDNPDPYFGLGRICQNRSNTEKAIYNYEKYLYLGGKEEEEVKEILKFLKNNKH